MIGDVDKKPDIFLKEILVYEAPSDRASIASYDEDSDNIDY